MKVRSRSGSPIIFEMTIGIAIAISIFDEDRDRDCDLNFGDRVHALSVYNESSLYGQVGIIAYTFL